MTPNLRNILAWLIPVFAFMLGAWLFAWPAWREGTRLQVETAALERRVAGAGDLAATIDVLVTRVSESRKRESLQTKAIPPSADLADVIRSLSSPIDGHSIIDQTFTGGKPGPAVIGETLPFEATPLTIDMTARFDSVFQILTRAEQMERLVRIASLRLARPSDEREAKQVGLPGPDTELVLATIGLEAVSEAPLQPPAPDPGAKKR